MNMGELAFAGFTLLGGCFVLFELFAHQHWDMRGYVFVLGLLAGLAGFATVLGYHEVCCVNYRGGEYKRDGNNMEDWLTFILPLILQLSSFTAIVALRRRRLAHKLRHKQVTNG